MPPKKKPAVRHTVNRVQDGAEVRADLSLEDAQSECAILNAQARQQVGMTAPEYVNGDLVGLPVPIFGSMIHGDISRYEVRSTSGLVI